MLGSKKLVTSIETSFPCWEIFSLFSFASVVLFIRKQWCRVRHLDATIKSEGSCRVHSFHSFPIKRPSFLKKCLTKVDWNSSVYPSSLLRCLMSHHHSPSVLQMKKLIYMNVSASARVKICLANLAKDQNFL